MDTETFTQNEVRQVRIMQQKLRIPFDECVSIIVAERRAQAARNAQMMGGKRRLTSYPAHPHEDLYGQRYIRPKAMANLGLTYADDPEPEVVYVMSKM